MTWTKLGDDFNDRGDLVHVSRGARLLYVELYVFANRLLLDGRIPLAQMRRVTDSPSPEADTAELIQAGVVEKVDAHLVVDWSDQPKREDVLAQRKHNAEKQARYRKRVAAHARGDHDLCDSRYCKASVTGSRDGNKDGLVTSSRPVQTSPVRRTEDWDIGGSASSAGAPHDDRQQGTTAGLRLATDHLFQPDPEDPSTCAICPDDEADHMSISEGAA